MGVNRATAKPSEEKVAIFLNIAEAETLDVYKSLQSIKEQSRLVVRQ